MDIRKPLVVVVMSSSPQPTPPTQATFVPPPPPSLNGGLYTGTPFDPNGGWRNYPVPPDAGNYQFGSLTGVSSAPVAARYMMPGGGLRPGNNTPLVPQDYAGSRIDDLNAICVPQNAYAPRPDPDANHGFRGYSYL